MSLSIWTLKKQPLGEVVGYIRSHGSPSLQAEMAGLPLETFRALSDTDAADRLASAIAAMDDEVYTDYLLELIDE